MASEATEHYAVTRDFLNRSPAMLGVLVGESGDADEMAAPES